MYADDDPGWIAARQALADDGGDLSVERGVPLVVAIFPLFGNPLDDGYPFADEHAKVAQAASESGAKVVDLLPRYQGLRWELLVVDGPRDEHPNEIAHRIAAQALVRAVDEVVPTRVARLRAMSSRAAALLVFVLAVHGGLAAAHDVAATPPPSTRARTCPPATPTSPSAITG